MKRHITNTQNQLGDLAGLEDKTERTERRILSQAESRLEDVQRLIERAQTGVVGAQDDAQQRYLDLIAERGQLQIVIARAREVLSKQ